MDTTIRAAEQKDLQGILEIINYEIEHTTSVYHYQPRTNNQLLKWFQKKQIDQMPVIVAERLNQILRFATYGIFRPWDAYQYSVEHSIYIHQGNRSRGVGKLLMKELLRLARADGYHTMIAGIDTSNESSIAFHKRFGFKEIGTFKQVGYKFDQWLDLRFLQLFL